MSKRPADSLQIGDHPLRRVRYSDHDEAVEKLHKQLVALNFELGRHEQRCYSAVAELRALGFSIEEITEALDPPESAPARSKGKAPASVDKGAESAVSVGAPSSQEAQSGVKVADGNVAQSAAPQGEVQSRTAAEVLFGAGVVSNGAKTDWSDEPWDAAASAKAVAAALTQSTADQSLPHRPAAQATGTRRPDWRKACFDYRLRNDCRDGDRCKWCHDWALGGRRVIFTDFFKNLQAAGQLPEHTRRAVEEDKARAKRRRDEAAAPEGRTILRNSSAPSNTAGEASQEGSDDKMGGSQ